MARKNLQYLTEERAAEERSKVMKRKAKASPVAKPLRSVRREQLLAQAKATQGFEPVAQRYAVNKLILESVWSRACTPAEILEAAYQDPKGHRYWELWLFEPLPIYQFAELLALDSAAANGVAVLDRYLFQIFERLRAAAEAGETWLIGDMSPLITETWSSLALRNCAVTVRPREAIAWMHRNPNARHLVPTVLAGMAESLTERTNAIGADGRVSSDTMSQVRTSTSRTSSVARASIVGKRPRRGPTPGEIDRHAVSDRALFPEVNRLVGESHKSVHAAALELALAGKIEGVGTPESRAKRLAKRFRKERLSAATH